MSEVPVGGCGLLLHSPDLFKKVVKDWIMFLELGADEGKEVVPPGVSDSAFAAKSAMSKLAVVARSNWMMGRLRLAMAKMCSNQGDCPPFKAANRFESRS
jgi:hypothetical protein